MIDDTKRFVLCAVVTGFSAAICVISNRKKQARSDRAMQPRYHWTALFHPVSFRSTPPWRQFLACVLPASLIISINVHRVWFFDTILPLFERKRPLANHERLYWTSVSRRGRKPVISTINLLRLFLCFLESSEQQYILALSFGLIPFFLLVSIDYELEVM